MATKAGAFAGYVTHLGCTLIAAFYLWEFLLTRGEINMLFVFFLAPLVVVATIAICLSWAIRTRTLVRLGYLTAALTLSFTLAGMTQLGYLLLLVLVPAGLVLTPWAFAVGWRDWWPGSPPAVTSHVYRH